MSVSITVTLDTRELDRIAAELDVKKAQVGKTIGPMVLASAKGFAPRKSGALITSINLAYPGGDVLARVQTDIHYAKYQELGFHHYISGRFIQNPFFVPAIEQHAGIFFKPSMWKVLFT